MIRVKGVFSVTPLGICLMMLNTGCLTMQQGYAAALPWRVAVSAPPARFGDDTIRLSDLRHSVSLDSHNHSPLETPQFLADASSLWQSLLDRRQSPDPGGDEAMPFQAAPPPEAAPNFVPRHLNGHKPKKRGAQQPVADAEPDSADEETVESSAQKDTLKQFASGLSLSPSSRKSTTRHVRTARRSTPRPEAQPSTGRPYAGPMVGPD